MTIQIKDSHLPSAPPLPSTALPIVSVTAATDSAYLPHMGALLVSILNNAQQDRFIDLIILENDLTEQEKLALVGLEKLHPHCKISFVDMSKQFLALEINLQYSKNTLFRLLIPAILNNRDKVLYLDTDMIVLGNVGELFDINLEDKVAAITRNLAIQAFCTLQVKSSVRTGKLPADKYLAEYLNLGDKIDDYFQSGTMLLDLKKLRETNLCEQAIQDIYTQHFWFADQDVLNKYWLGKVKFVDNAWNWVMMHETHLPHLTPTNSIFYNAAMQAPKILHFAGDKKPWRSTANPFYHYYWYYLRQTIWYEHVLFQNIAYFNSGTPQHKHPSQSLIRKILRKVWWSLPTSIQNAMQPIATKVRSAIQ